MCRFKSITRVNLQISSECKKENANCNINKATLIWGKINIIFYLIQYEAIN